MVLALFIIPLNDLINYKQDFEGNVFYLMSDVFRLKPTHPAAVSNWATRFTCKKVSGQFRGDLWPRRAPLARFHSSSTNVREATVIIP